MTTNDTKSYLPYLNELVDQYNNTFHHFNNKNLLLLIILLTEKNETNHKAAKVKVNDRVKITKYKNIFSKGYTEHWSREMIIINTVLKTNP